MENLPKEGKEALSLRMTEALNSPSDFVTREQLQSLYEAQAPPPVRVVYDRPITPEEREALEEKIREAIENPQWTIITDYEISWEDNCDPQLEEEAFEAARRYIPVGVTPEDLIQRHRDMVVVEGLVGSSRVKSVVRKKDD
jgi:hypothetical protein